MHTPKTVIEQARRQFGASQAQLAQWARTSQSSVSEYESRRKSPTLEVVERLLGAIGFELAIKPIIGFEKREDSEVGIYLVPEALWSVPMPDCLSKVQVSGLLYNSGDVRRTRVWDLSVEAERIDYYQWVILSGSADLMMDSVDGILLMQAWDRLDLPEVVRAAWQPAIDTATAPQDRAPRDPGGVSAWLANEIGVPWKPIGKRRQRT